MNDKSSRCKSLHTSILIFYLILWFANSAFSADKVVNLVFNEWPPFYGKNLKGNGVIYQIIQMSFGISSYRVESKFLPFLRALQYAKKNREIDGIIALSKQAKDAKYFYYSERPIIASQVFIYKRSENKITLDGFKSKTCTIGVLKNSNFESLIKNYNHRIELFNSQKISLESLKLEHIAFVLGYSHDIEPLLNRYSEINRIEKPLKQTLLYLCIHKSAKSAEEKIQAFNLGYQRIKSSEEYEKLLKEFFHPYCANCNPCPCCPCCPGCP